MKLTLATSRSLVSKTAWLETLVLTGILPAVGYKINAIDPFYLDNRFPWLILAPLLVTLRYGFIFGMSSAVSLISLLALGRYLDWPIAPVFPVEMAVGMVLITMIAAEFQDISRQKLQQLQHKYHYLKLRTDEFSRAYHVLKGSHSLLEQQTDNHKKSMRNVLLDLQGQVLSLAKHDGELLGGIGDPILNLFSEYGSIQVASLYAVSEERKISSHPVACLGKPPALWPANLLIKEALKTGHVTSIRTFDEEAENEVLVVIPLIDVFQRIWGVVIVNEMSMFALQKNTLDLLSLLGGHVGDLIKRRAVGNLLDKNVWLEFECDLRRTLEEVRSFETVAAMVVSIVSSEALYDALMSLFRAECRGLDKVLTFRDDLGRQVIIQLLPLTDENGLKDFLSRLNLKDILDRKTSLTSFEEGKAFQILDANVAIYSWILSDKHSPEKVLSKIEQLCQHNISDHRNRERSHAGIPA